MVIIFALVVVVCGQTFVELLAPGGRHSVSGPPAGLRELEGFTAGEQGRLPMGRTETVVDPRAISVVERRPDSVRTEPPTEAIAVPSGQSSPPDYWRDGQNGRLPMLNTTFAFSTLAGMSMWETLLLLCFNAIYRACRRKTH